MGKNLIDADMEQQLLEALRKRHGTRLKDETLTVSAQMDGSNVVANLVLAKRDRTYVYDMNAAVDSEDRRLRSVDEALDLVIDFLDWYLGEYFKESREILLPLDWQPHQFGDYEVLARGDVRNEILDDAADAWLRGERPKLD